MNNEAATTFAIPDLATGCEIISRLSLANPPQALFMHSLTDWSGLKAKVNLYKCGDKLSQPHFLSWKPIAAPKPDFHLPEFFEQIKFSKI